MEDKERDRLAAELEKVKANMSRSDLEKLILDAELLKKLQETDEDVSSLPTLVREDIPPAVPRVNASTSFPDISASGYEQPTSGIFYLAMAAGVGSVKKQLLPLVPFFCFALPKMGTALQDYTDMAQRIDLYTGGLRLSAHARTGFDGAGACVPFISFNTKCLVRNQAAMFEIFEELLLHFDFSNLSRLKNLLLEYRANLEAMIIHNGHRLAISRAAMNFSTARRLSEIWSGIHLVQTIKTLTDDLTETGLQSVAAELTAIGKNLFGRDNVKMALIGEEASFAKAVAMLADIEKQLSGTVDTTELKNTFSSPTIDTENKIPWEGWSTATAVSFVAQSFETVRMAHEDAPALAVISKILRSMYLHREIREKGGAYGGFAVYNSEDGLFSFASYRDPHIVSTLNVFDQAAQFIRSGDYSEEDINEAILQICADIDKPDAPGAAARKAFYREIISLSDEARQDYKERILALTRKQVLGTAEKYFDSQNQAKAVAVISGEQQLKTANQNMSAHPLELHRI
jgi:Zn-dependent M16 (insulinase) family peptidase